jgi:hypothetical protein
MAKFRYQHIKSSVEGKAPTSSQIKVGEIGVNDFAGDEKLFIKNSENEVVDFPRGYSRQYITASLNDLEERKLDASAYTPTDLSDYYTKEEIDEQQETVAAALNDLNSQSETVAAALVDLNTRKANVSDIPSVNGYADSVKYNSESHYVEFYHGTTAGTKVFEYDASPFLIDGMVESVVVTSITSGGSEIQVLEITWNSAAGSQVTDIPLSDIFDPDEYYTKDEVDEADRVIAEALNDLNTRKLDASAYTPTDLSNYYTKSETSGATELATAFSNIHTHSNKSELDSITGNVGTMAYENANSYSSATEVNTALSNKANASDIPSVTGYADSVKYNDTNHYMEFYHGTTGGTKVYEFDASPFIIDGMVQDVKITAVTSGTSEVTCLVISFNTDAGKQDINIPLTDIFNADNYYNKTAIDNLVGSGFTSSSITDVIIENEEIVSSALNDLEERKLDASAYTPTDLSNYYTKSETSGATELATAFNGKADTATTLAGYGITDAYTKSETSGATEIQNALDGKLDSSSIDQVIDSTTSASTGAVSTSAVYDFVTAYAPSITVDNVIDNTTSASTNPVSTSAVYRCINDNELVISTAVNNLEENKADKEEDLDGIKLKKITQSAYDALVQAGTVDPNTLYIITD